MLQGMEASLLDRSAGELRIVLHQLVLALARDWDRFLDRNNAPGPWRVSTQRRTASAAEIRIMSPLTDPFNHTPSGFRTVVLHPDCANFAGTKRPEGTRGGKLPNLADCVCSQNSACISSAIKYLSGVPRVLSGRTSMLILTG